MTNQHTLSYSALFIAAVFVVSALFAPVALAEEVEPIVEPAPEVLAEPTPEVLSEPAPTPEPAVVETGDAAAVSDSGNEVNANDTTTSGGDTTVVGDNTAEVTNDGSAEAATGTNTASGGEGGAVVATGDAYASANAVNVVNTNIVDSAGLLYFKDFFASLGIDLRVLDLSFFLGESGCSSCGGDLTVTNTNDATLTNTVSATADTGGNTASTTDGAALVSTGNAYASANSVNFVNSNIVRSNYLLVSVNNFGDLMSDITLPGADFFRELLARGTGVGGDTSVTNTNTATVTTDTSATADTGGNTATGDGAVVETGTALAGSTSFNQVNTNLLGGTSLFFLFRIWGEWSGNVHGLPEGMSWTETPYGIVLTNDSSGASVGEGCNCSGDTTVTNTNNALVNNAISVYALTGDNKASSGSGSALVSTGNAYASANSVNIVNTNILGHNWIFAIFNIFGNFGGNVAFGHPDLWLGAAAEAENPSLTGSTIAYHFTVANMGDADATDVRINAEYLRGMLSFSEGQETSEGFTWSLGNIPKGEVRDFVYHASAGYVPHNTSISVPLTATVTSEETDEDTTDNTDQLSVIIAGPFNGGWQGEGFTSDQRLKVTKTASLDMGAVPASVDYDITIINDGGPAHNVLVTDVLTDPVGKVLKTKQWDIGDVAYNDEIHITYTAEFGGAIAPGGYKNTVTVTGTQNYNDLDFASAFTPVSTSHTFIALPGQVLGAATCEAYLTEYIRPGRDNNPAEVEKLQDFLNWQGFGPLEMTGEYDAATIAAVKAFQRQHQTSILAPWGYMRPTGFVYYTTQKAVNDIACGGSRTFGLSAEQQAEITQTRGLVETVVAPNVEPPPLEDLPLWPGIQIGGTENEGEPQQAVKGWTFLELVNPFLRAAAESLPTVSRTF